MTFFIAGSNIVTNYRTVGSLDKRKRIMDTHEKIKLTAIAHLGRYGYKGTSLSKIADDVGIRKPSLYSHYKSKRDLFEACMESAKSEFMTGAKGILRSPENTVEQNLYRFPASFIDAYNSDDSRLFYLRFAYMPPEELGENKVRYSNEFIESLADLVKDPVQKLIGDRDPSPEKYREALETYLCLFDGMMVELLFGGIGGYTARLDAVWPVFLRGIR